MNHLKNNCLSFDEAMIKCTNTLQSKHNPEQSLASLLKILGEYYSADSSYIFEFDEETQIFGSNYQWNSRESVEFANTFADLPFSALEYFSADRFLDDEIPIMTFVPSEFPNSPIDHLFEQVDNIMISPMVRKGKTTGFVGITNLSFEDFDSSLFGCIILFIQECLQKRDMHLQLAILHNLDPLTGFFNKIQYAKKLKLLEQRPPQQLGIVFIQLTGLEKTGEIYGEKYVDVKIKNASLVVSHFFEFPFYRLDTQKFICFVLNIEEDTFLSVMDQMRLETTSNSDACFTIGHTWCHGEINIHQEIARSNNGLEENLSENNKKKFPSPTECLLADLNRAIEAQEFVVYLQPKVELTSRKLVSAEALVRRLLPQNQMLVPPDTFVPLYENHAIIRHLDLHVLRIVCQMLGEWQKQGKELPISVNFSRVTLMDKGIAKVIAEICKEYGVPPHLVEIEITERLGASPDDLTNLVVEDFTQQGLTLILDDFGSTYSNFLTLTKVDIKEIKIDHSLVENLVESRKNQKILKSIIEMCDAIEGTRSLAEGIETQAQTEILVDLNCTYGQGFFFSPPIPIDEFFIKYMSE